MKIVTCYYNEKENYDHLIELFLYSAKKQMPEIEVEVIRPEIDLTKAVTYSSPISNTLEEMIIHKSLTRKLDVWNTAVQNSKEDLILCDCDVIFLKDVSGVFKNTFDFAYTGRKHTKVPVNSGVVFVKNTAMAKKFFQHWTDTNDLMQSNKSFYTYWSSLCSGTNQPALYYLIKNKWITGAKLLELPCRVYNSCEADWNTLRKDTCILHLKETLRNYLNGDKLKYMKRLNRNKKAFKIYDKLRQEYYEMR
jgi:hypothetical protein